MTRYRPIVPDAIFLPVILASRSSPAPLSLRWTTCSKPVITHLEAKFEKVAAASVVVAVSAARRRCRRQPFAPWTHCEGQW